MRSLSSFVRRHVWGSGGHAGLLLACLLAGPVTAAETVSVTVTDAQASEPGTDAGLVTIKRAVATATALTVSLTRTGTATAGVDYDALPATVTIPANATSVLVPIQPLDDTTAEVSETVIVTIAANAAYTIGSPSSGTVTIADDEPVRVTLIASDASAGEPGTNTGAFTLTRTGSLTAPLLVNLQFAGTATGGLDYQALASPVSINAGSSTRVVTVTPLNDTIPEPDETVTCTLASGTYVMGTTTAATVTIADNEAPVLTLTVSDATASEPGTDTGQFQVNRLGLKTAALTATFTIAGTATPGTDYTALSGSVVLAANAVSATLTVTPINDTVCEPDETVDVTLTAGSGYTVGNPVAQSLVIRDDEWAVAVVATDAIASEPTGDAGTFTITRSGAGATTAALIVPYTISGTATSGTDFTALSGTATIAAGATTTTVVVTPVNDTAVESLETVVLTITPAATYVVTGTPASVSIVDNDTPIATVQVATTDGTATEAVGNGGLFTVNRSGLTTGDLVVSYAITGTATAGADYTTLTGTVTIPSGVASALIPVVPLEDPFAEASETVIVTLLPNTTHLLGTTKTGTVTISDNETPEITIAATDATASEPAASQANGVFTITRTGNRALAVTVPLTVTGTATSGSDFTALPTSVTLAANATTATVTVTPVNDIATEADEMVVVTLTPGSAYKLATGSASVLLLDDETPSVSIVATDAAAVENPVDTGQFSVSRLGNRTTAITVALSTTGSTATSGTDVTALPATVSLAANVVSATVTVTPVNDALIEGNETVLATVGTGTGYVVGAPASAQVVIADDEPVVTITAVDASAVVPSDVGVFTVRRTGPLTAALTVPMVFSGTALSGGDYTALPTSVTLPINVSGISLVVRPIRRTGAPASMTVIATLQAGATYALGTAAATVTIQNNLPPVVRIQAQPYVAGTPTSVTLDASTSTDPNADTLSYYWYNYGLGISVNGPVFTGNLTTPGLTSITLVVQDGTVQVVRSVPLTWLTAPATITAATTTYDNGILIVDATTVTIDGPHSFFAARIINGGILTCTAGTTTQHPSAVNLTVVSDVTVAYGAAIDVSGRGYARGRTNGNTTVGAGTELAGGSHGGYGGDQNSPGASFIGIAGEPYDDFMDPSLPGAGAPLNASDPSAPASGGGVVRISAGSMVLDGIVAADGQASGSTHVGGGAGGSVRVAVTGGLSGSGTMRANGGSNSGYNGSGGGGRVSVTYGSGSFGVSSCSANGGSWHGGAGSIYLKKATDAQPIMAFVNAGGGTSRSTPLWFGTRASSTDDPVVFETGLVLSGQADVTVESSVTTLRISGTATTLGEATFAAERLSATTLTLDVGHVLKTRPCTVAVTRGLSLSVDGLLTIVGGASIDVSGQGYVRGRTNGNTTVGAGTELAGGSHGGYGGDQNSPGANFIGIAGEPYDDFMDPSLPGAGAPLNTSDPTALASGGGVIRISAGSMVLDGVVAADGQKSESNYVGGGAGGSVRVAVTGGLSGSGTVRANGGLHSGYNGSGGGGRVSVTFGSGSFGVSSCSANGGSWHGGAGSIYLKKATDAQPIMAFVNAGGGPSRSTPLWFGSRASSTDDPVVFETGLALSGQADVTVESSVTTLRISGIATTLGEATFTVERLSASSLTLASGHLLRHRACTASKAYGLSLVVDGALTIDVGAAIDVTGNGYVRGYTNGNTTSGASTESAGGSHGGWGGDSRITGGYATNGIAGLLYDNFWDPALPGGGSGFNTFDPLSPASGGGVVRITTGSCTLDGNIVARGGNGVYNVGGGAGGSILLRSNSVIGGIGTLNADGGTNGGSFNSGGGGRIAIYAPSGFALERTTVTSPYGYGLNGTVYIRDTTQAYGILHIPVSPNPVYWPTSVFAGDPNGLAFSQPVCPEAFDVSAPPGATYLVVGDPMAFDADRDGLSAFEEVRLGTNPLSADENGDGIGDQVSISSGINPHALDHDGDTISNAAEILAGTDPFYADSDRDGVPDNLDVAPLDSNRSSWSPSSPTDTIPPQITIDAPVSAMVLP